MFGHFDHPIINALMLRRAERRRLRARHSREHAATPKNRRPERLEVAVLETPPDVARERVEMRAVHPLGQATPARDNDRRRR